MKLSSKTLNCLFIALLSMSCVAITHAHESRPAYLQITQTQADVFDVTWRRPARGERVLSLQPVFPPHCRPQGEVVNYSAGGAHNARWKLQCSDEGLAGHTIYIEGLAETITDVLVRLQFLDGVHQTQILKPNAARMSVQKSPSPLQVIGDYFSLGVEHILGGIDHLLFVLCLMLIVNGHWRLVKTITAFTVAHSITLAIATLGIVQVAQAPVEAVIALSICFLAVELVKQQQGKVDFAMRSPWVVAFIFGLLHGFGFAGALAEVGLPQADIPLALLMFNVGVEAGQLLFIGALLVIMQVWNRFAALELNWLPKVTVYSIGTIASFWVIERVMAF